jgi:addiction module HigA family antidote
MGVTFMAKRDITHYPAGAPIRPVHPGETLREELADRGLSASALALRLRVPANRLGAIINGERAISAETALRLGRYFGTGATFWMNLQAQYDLAVAERDLGARIAREVEVGPN